MADEQTQAVTNEATQAAAANPASATTPTQEVEDVNALPAWAQRIIGDLRKESASHRKAKTEAERVAQAQQETAAKEQGKWQELAQQWEPKAKRADELEKFVKDTLEAELTDIPERVKTIVPAYDDPLKTLEWVRNAKAAGILAKPNTPNTDAANGTGDKSANGAVAARQTELDWWRQMGFHNAVAAAEKQQR